MKIYKVMTGLCAAVVLAAAVSAQTVSPGLEYANPEMMAAKEKAAVRQLVEEFLVKLGNRDLAGVRAAMTPKALMVVVRQRDGAFVNSFQTGEEWLAQLEKNTNAAKFEEPLTNVHVTVDSGRLGYLRADFTVVRDGKVMSSGVDHFTLVKEPDGWKIAAAAYTSLPAPQSTR
jgi:ketosteroid isomerase-like protein